MLLELSRRCARSRNAVLLIAIRCVRLSQLEKSRERKSRQTIEDAIKESGCDLPVSTVLGLERLSARELACRKRSRKRARKFFHRWLNEVVKPGRVVGIGRSGRRLVMVTEKRDGKRSRYSRRRKQRQLSAGTNRPRLFACLSFARTGHRTGFRRDSRTRPRTRRCLSRACATLYAEETDALKILDDSIDNLLPSRHHRVRIGSVALKLLWELHETAEDYERATRRIEALREEVWLPFEQRASVLSVFGYLDFEAEKVTERGRWLADLHIDRPLLVGEALESGLFNSLDLKQLAGIMAALTADEDRDYGDLELDDDIVTSLSQFEDIGFKVSAEEWKYGVEPAPELNFSAAGAAVLWASGATGPRSCSRRARKKATCFACFPAPAKRFYKSPVCIAVIRRRRRWRPPRLK